jgi:hypothetical protein
LKDIKDPNSINVDQFIECASKNIFWKNAGDFVVKELIFLDCLHTYYFEERSMLNDEDYSTLKDDLTWEGSAVVTLSGKEARFINAVSSY